MTRVCSRRRLPDMGSVCPTHELPHTIVQFVHASLVPMCLSHNRHNNTLLLLMFSPLPVARLGRPPVSLPRPTAVSIHRYSSTPPVGRSERARTHTFAPHLPRTHTPHTAASALGEISFHSALPPSNHTRGVYVLWRQSVLGFAL
jgi:hypothetical protein